PARRDARRARPGDIRLLAPSATAKEQQRMTRHTTSDDAPSATPHASHPVTLFTGQWADLPFEEVARLAAEWGYDGLEIAASGDHLDLARADEDDAYVQSRLEVLDRF